MIVVQRDVFSPKQLDSILSMFQSFTGSPTFSRLASTNSWFKKKLNVFEKSQKSYSYVGILNWKVNSQDHGRIVWMGDEAQSVCPELT